jgi:hypothetical protein
MDNNQTHFNNLATAHDSAHETISPETELSTQTTAPVSEDSPSESLTPTLTAAASAGITGAVIGHLIGKHTVGGRVGATIGAVVGSMAGAALGREVAHSDTAGAIAEQAKEVVGDTVEQVKAVAEDTMDRVKDAVPGMKATEPDHDRSELQPEVQPIEPSEQPQATVTPTDLLLAQPHLSEAVAQTHYHLGLTLGREGQLEQAIEEFQEVLDVMPESAETYYNLGVAFNKQGDVDQALDCMYRARDLCTEQDKEQGARIVEQAIAAIQQHQSQ